MRVNILENFKKSQEGEDRRRTRSDVFDLDQVGEQYREDLRDLRSTAEEFLSPEEIREMREQRNSMDKDIITKSTSQLMAERFARGVPTGAYAKSNAVDDALQQARDPAAYMNKIGAKAPRVTMDWSHDIDAIGAKPEGQTFMGGLGNQAREGISQIAVPLEDAAWAQDGYERARPDTDVLKKIFENNSPEDLSKIFGKDLVSKAYDFYKNYFKIA